MDAAGFEAAYAARSGVTVEALRRAGRYPEPCDCGDDLCEGWGMGWQHEDAIAEDEARRGGAAWSALTAVTGAGPSMSARIAGPRPVRG